jgi:hypothetical protein
MVFMQTSQTVHPYLLIHFSQRHLLLLITHNPYRQAMMPIYASHRMLALLLEPHRASQTNIVSENERKLSRLGF